MPLQRRTALGALFFAIAVLLVASSARSNVSFDPPNGVIEGNETLTVDVRVDAAVLDLRGFTFVFEFDSTIVKPISVQAGPLVTGAACPHFLTWVNIAAVGDSIYVDGATLGCSVNGPGSIVRLTFVGGPAYGISPLRCRSSTLRNSLNQTIPCVCVAGTIEHRPPIAVARRPWGHVKKYYR